VNIHDDGGPKSFVASIKLKVVAAFNFRLSKADKIISKPLALWKSYFYLASPIPTLLILRGIFCHRRQIHYSTL
jgi:hypothetical protein